MATTFTEADVEALRAAIRLGAKRVEYEDKAVTYHSLDEMMRALRVMEEALGIKKRSSRLYAEASKGLK